METWHMYGSMRSSSMASSAPSCGTRARTMTYMQTGSSASMDQVTAVLEVVMSRNIARIASSLASGVATLLICCSEATEARKWWSRIQSW